MLQFTVFQAGCCSTDDSGSLFSELNSKYDEIETKELNILKDSGDVTVPADVISTLLTYGSKAMPLTLINDKVTFRGSLPNIENAIRAIEKSKKKEMLEAYNPDILIRPVVLQQHLLSPAKLDYGIVTPQCCSTTYFCACSST